MQSKNLFIQKKPEEIDYDLKNIQTLDKLCDYLDLTTPNNSDGKNFGRLYSQIHPAARKGRIKAVELNAAGNTLSAFPALAVIEKNIISMLLNQFGMIGGGTVVPGGSYANAMAIFMALTKRFPDFLTTGIQTKPVKILVSENSHYSITKSALFMSLGVSSVVKIKTDHQGQMSIRHIQQVLDESEAENVNVVAIFSTAGATIGGQFDNVQEINQCIQGRNIYHHVDASWGGAAVFGKKKNLFQGMSNVDSLTFDAHKALGAGLTNAYFLTTRPKLLRKANDCNVSYIAKERPEYDEYNLINTNQSCGRDAGSLGFYFMYKELGVDGLSGLMNHLYDIYETAEDIFSKAADIQILKKHYLNICIQIVSANETITSSELTEQIFYRIEKESDFKIAKGYWKGTFVLRFVAVNPNTTQGDLNDFVDYLSQLKSEISNRRILKHKVT